MRWKRILRGGQKLNVLDDTSLEKFGDQFCIGPCTAAFKTAFLLSNRVDIPKQLDGWTGEYIVGLAGAGVSEPAAFDFKGGAILRDPTGVSKLSKTACAFANSGGGFIVIGVEEDGPRWRPVGISKSKEINRLINDHIKVEPPVSYPEPREVPVPGSPGKVFYVVQIPDTDNGPHASVAEKTTVFYERNHSGSVSMSWHRIRDRMLRVEERKAKAEMLIHELQQHMLLARGHVYADIKKAEMHVEPFEISTTRRLFEDLYPLASSNKQWVMAASGALRAMNRFNAELQYYADMVAGVGGKSTAVMEAKFRLQRGAHQAWTAIKDFYVWSGSVFGIKVDVLTAP